MGNNSHSISEEIFEEKEGYHIVVEMAGVKKEDVQIEADGSFLMLKAERKTRSDKPYLKPLKIARQYRVNSKVLSSSDLTATFEDGVLDIYIPKTQKIVKKIEIQ
jgi:HSP20 family protein